MDVGCAPKKKGYTGIIHKPNCARAIPLEYFLSENGFFRDAYSACYTVVFFIFCCFAMNRQPHGSRYVRPYGTTVCPPYIRRGWWLQMSSSAKYWWRYSVGWVVGMWSDLGLAELWVVCLDKNTNKNRVKRNRRNWPWRPASSYGRYGAPLLAIKHTTINYYSILWVGIVKSEKNINYYY